MSEQKAQFHTNQLKNGPFKNYNLLDTNAAYIISHGGGGYLKRIIINKGITGTVVVRDMAAAATADKVLAAQATSTAETVVSEAGLAAQPAYARKLTILPGGTTADVAAGDVTVYGTDSDGVAIEEAFTFLANASTATNGTKRFKTVTRIVFPAQDGAGATWDVGELDGDLIGTMTNPIAGGIFEYDAPLVEGLVVTASATPDISVKYLG